MDSSYNSVSYINLKFEIKLILHFLCRLFITLYSDFLRGFCINLMLISRGIFVMELTRMSTGSSFSGHKLEQRSRTVFPGVGITDTTLLRPNIAGVATTQLLHITGVSCARYL
jgi:hypothetical protein